MGKKRRERRRRRPQSEKNRQGVRKVEIGREEGKEEKETEVTKICWISLS